MTDFIKFIGSVSSPLRRLEDCPRQEREQAPAAVLVISDEYEKAVRDLEVGMEIVVLTWFHKASRETQVTKPRNDPKAPDTGVFATRSPDRPNPIGLHVVSITAIDKNNITVNALEALDGTPVIDIKPVI